MSDELALGRSEEIKPARRFTAESAKGGRSYNEDRYFADTVRVGDRALDVLAVMDGHGGTATARFAAQNLEFLFKEAYKATAANLIETLGKLTLALSEATRHFDSGSTFSVVVIPRDEKRAYVAILGDSPVIIWEANGELNISPQHNARTSVAERAAAIKRGAIFDGDYLYDPITGMGLQMSRALGDQGLDSFLNREPEVYAVELGPESFVVVATDGLFDPAHHETKAEIKCVSKMVAAGAGAEGLVQDALARRTGDNTTAIVWRPA